jgi:hypothetical protein
MVSNLVKRALQPNANAEVPEGARLFGVQIQSDLGIAEQTARNIPAEIANLPLYKTVSKIPFP